ncbi:MAG: hypothetical protein HY474_01865 [Candidatus Sungbacteria bacterium]|uniref:Glycosyltransferase RgtA/B/C/D-like domain-containing protein n=1 Tax=Candidatus Sungiibacteriota bacterium TaxID=2750080 RepID=A0A933DTW8_9BACT|nr:hypothetical protein [Candidatus Sungbacteria bacterium]
MFLQNFNPLVLIESVLFIYASYALGDAVLRLAGFDLSSRIKRVVYRLLIGYGIFALIGLVLALVGLFNAAALRIAFFAVLIFSARTIFSHLCGLARLGFVHKNLSGLFRDYPFFKALIALWLFANIFIVFVPITGWDALDYHLPIINDIITKERADFTPAIPSYNYLPILAEIFYAVPIVLFGETGAPYVFQFLMYSVLPLLLALIYDFLRDRVADRRLAIAAPLLILSLFDFQREIMHAGYIDVFVFLFSIASTLLLIEAAASRTIQQSGIVLSAAMLGIALSMKYLAFFSLATNGLLLAILAWRAREGLGWLVRWGSVCLLVIAAIAGYWYVRNAAWFGSPVYPMFSSAEFTGAVENLIVERTPQNFFLFPFARFGRWFSDPNETSSRLVPLAYFGVLYILLPLTIFVRHRLSAAEALLLLAMGLWLLFSFLTSHQIRFLLPAVLFLVPFLVLLADSILASIRTRLAGTGALASRLAVGALGLLFVVTFLGNFHYFQIRFLYAFGVYTEEQYIGSIGSQ